MSKPILTLPCKYTLTDFEKRDGKHHCAVCDHSLKDFRNSTNEEILQAISQPGTKTCGIFYPSQLGSRTSSFTTGFQRQIGLSLLGILGFMGPALLTSCDNAPPAGPQDPIREQSAFSKLKFPLYLRGKLIDKNTKEPVKNASIRILQHDKTLLTGTTDKDGNFKIRIGQNDLSDTHFDLILHRYGYVNDTISAVDASKLEGHLRLTIAAEQEKGAVCKPGEVVVIDAVSGDIAPPLPTIEGEIAIPEPPTAGVPMMENE